MEKENKVIKNVEAPKVEIKLGDKVKYQNQEYIVTNLLKNGKCHIAMGENTHDVEFKDITFISK